MEAFDILILITVAAVVGALGIGIFNLSRPGTQARSRSNKLMRLRVVLQALAVVLILVATWWKASQG